MFAFFSSVGSFNLHLSLWLLVVHVGSFIFPLTSQVGNNQRNVVLQLPGLLRFSIYILQTHLFAASCIGSLQIADEKKSGKTSKISRTTKIIIYVVSHVNDSYSIVELEIIWKKEICI